MAKMLVQCFSAVSDCFHGTNEWSWAKTPAARATSTAASAAHNTPAVPDVVLDSSSMGQEAVIVKNGSRLCGTGAARSSAPIQQNKAYWEVKVQQSGIWSCGVATAASDLNVALGGDARSWIITSDNKVRTNAHDEYELQQKIQEGDVIGFTYDHVELNFYLNGVNLNCPVLGIKGTVYPVLYVDDGAILDAIFESFRSQPPAGFDRILIEKALL